MGKIQTCLRRHLIIPVLMLLASNLIHAHGRSAMSATKKTDKAFEAASTRRLLIGSSPPRCQRQCGSCSRCEAVQVPIVPQQLAVGTSELFADNAAFPARIFSPRGGRDVSNYKPMTWKCKCGNLLLNP